MARIEVYEKNDHDLNINFSDSDTGSPEDISEWKIYFTVKTDRADADSAALIQKSVGSGEHLDPTNGSTIIHLSYSDTDLTPGTYWYDFKTVEPTGSVTTVAVDRFKLLDAITDATN